MADMQKKMGAALAAVSAYLQDEEAAASLQAKPENAGPHMQLNLWGQSGRQEMMNMRKLIQMRAFARCR